MEKNTVGITSPGKRSKVGSEEYLKPIYQTAHRPQYRQFETLLAQIDKRVDDWLNKVNNVSLQEINRYQFRRADHLNRIFSSAGRARGTPNLQTTPTRSTIRQFAFG